MLECEGEHLEILSPQEEQEAVAEAEAVMVESPYCPVCGSCGDTPGCHKPDRCKYLNAHQGAYDDLVRENEQREAQVAALAEALMAIKSARLSYYGESWDSFADRLKAIAHAALSPQIEALAEQRRAEREFMDAAMVVASESDDINKWNRFTTAAVALRAAREVPHA